MAIKHTKISAVADGGDTSVVQPSDWNANHTIEAGTVSTTELGGDITVAGKAILDDVDAAAQRATLGAAATAHTHALADITDEGALAALNTVGAAQIDNDAVTNAKLADVATQTFKGRTTAGAGDPEDLTVAQAKTLLNLTGTNSGDQTITLTGDVTGSGTGSFAATIANDAVTYAKLQNVSASRLLGRATASIGDVEEITLGTNLSFTGTTLNATGGGGASWDAITAAAASATTANGDHAIVYQVAQTTASRVSWNFTESAASTSTGTPVLVQIDTIAASTAIPLLVKSRGVDVFRVNAAAPTVQFINGNAGAPTINFGSATTSGLASTTAGTFSLIGGGTEACRVRNTGLELLSGSGVTPALTSIAFQTSGLFFAANVLGISTASEENARFASGVFQPSKGSADAVAYAINARKSRGTVAAPTVITSGDDLLTISGYGYVGATNTYQEACRINMDSQGIISDSATGIGGLIRFSAAGVGFEPVESLWVQRNIVNVPAGSTAQPGLTDLTTGSIGLYWPSSTEIGIAGNSREMVRWKLASAGGGWQIMDEADSDPTTTELDSLDSGSFYFKNNKFVIAYNNAGTITYITIPLDGSSTAWTHSTTAP